MRFGGFLQGARRAARPEGGCCTRSGQAPAKPGRSAGRMGGGMRCVFCRELQGAGAARAARQRRRSGRRPLKPPGGRALHAQRAGPGEAGALGGPYGRRDAVRFLQGAARGAAGAAQAARQRRRSGRRPLKPPGGRLGCARCLRFAGGYGADAKPRGRPVRRGTDTSYLSPQIQPGKEPLWQTGKLN